MASVYHPAASQWARRVGAAIASVAPVTAPPQEFRVGYAPPPTASLADRSVSVNLPRGDYLLRVRIVTNAGESAARAIVATSAGQANQAFGELGPDFDSAPYTSVDSEVFLERRHTGGTLVVSQFDRSANAAILGVAAHSVEPLHDYRVDRRDRSFQPMPPVAQWTLDGRAGIDVSRVSHGYRVRGDDSQFGYQMFSPPIPVGPRETVHMKLDYEIEHGKVCVGVLGGSKSSWLVSPSEARRELSFQSGSERAVHLVFANCNKTTGLAERSLVTVRSAAYSRQDSELYTDMLMKAR